MHPAIESVFERPTGHKLAIWALSLVVVAGGSWQFVYSGILGDLEKVTQEVEQLDTSVATERRLAGSLDKAKAKLKDLEIKFSTALAELPDKSEVDELLAKISDLVRESSLELLLFQRKEENYREFYVEVPVALSVSGNYHQIATFFDEVARLPRVVNVQNLSVAEPKVTDEQVTVKSDSVLTAYRFLQESERAIVQKGEEKKKGAGK